MHRKENARNSFVEVIDRVWILFSSPIRARNEGSFPRKKVLVVLQPTHERAASVETRRHFRLFGHSIAIGFKSSATRLQPQPSHYNMNSLKLMLVFASAASSMMAEDPSDQALLLGDEYRRAHPGAFEQGGIFGCLTADPDDADSPDYCLDSEFVTFRGHFRGKTSSFNLFVSPSFRLDDFGRPEHDQVGATTPGRRVLPVGSCLRPPRISPPYAWSCLIFWPSLSFCAGMDC